jgi:cellulose synthase/poly-beta-1,6-N-acetylglucosamine synthase-like glycosyltransferase
MVFSKDRSIILQSSYIVCVVISVFLFSILFYNFTEFLSIPVYDALLIVWPALLFDLGRSVGKAVILPMDVILRSLRPPPKDFKPRLISIIIPARNEEKTIGSCIEAILENNYLWKEVVVVDDGSEDNTYFVAKKYEETGVVKVVRKDPSGYKASSVNYGLLFSKGEIVLSLDADTLVSRDSLEWVARYFEDERLVAGAGNLRVLNRDVNLLTRLQAYEYFAAFEMGRRTQSLLRTLLIIPGAAAIYRRSLLESLGFLDRTLAEDFDVTLKFHKVRGKLIFMPEVLAWTEVPVNWRGWIRQRIRWSMGQLHSLRRHSQLFFRRRFGVPGLIGAPDMVLVDMVLLFAWSIWLTWVILAQTPITTLFMLLVPVLLYSELLTISTSRIVSKDPEPFSILILFPLATFFYRPLYGIVRYIGYLYEVLGKQRRW